MTTKEAINLMTDAAIAQGADCNDTNGVVRSIVTAHGLSFDAWFCVCCEIADRKARSEGYEHSVDKAFQLARSRVAAKLTR